jgi:hypothetical protein
MAARTKPTLPIVTTGHSRAADLRGDLADLRSTWDALNWWFCAALFLRC